MEVRLHPSGAGTTLALSKEEVKTRDGVMIKSAVNVDAHTLLCSSCRERIEFS